MCGVLDKSRARHVRSKLRRPGRHHALPQYAAQAWQMTAHAYRWFLNAMRKPVFFWGSCRVYKILEKTWWGSRWALEGPDFVVRLATIS